MRNDISPEWFWSHVNVSKRDTDCWVWRGTRYSNGYGRVNWNMQQLLAHRVAYELRYGEIQNGLHVMHTCDHPPCVNPIHLRVGSASDNMRDCAAKGRLNPYSRIGERNPKAKLTENEVREIRRRRAEGEKVIMLAAEFSVAAANISAIAHKKTWKHV